MGSLRDERLSNPGAQRADREMADRAVTQDRELTDAERLDALRASYFAQALPDLPEIPGYHCIWLTTTNPRDPIPGRIRLGYEPIRASEIPGWEHSAIKSGQYEGFIGVNEMLAFKLPNRLYKMYMTEAHHDAPNREEEKLSAALAAIREQAQRKGADVEIDEGTGELGASKRGPKFEGIT